MSRITFLAVMAIVYPLSLLPYPVLYALSDALYYIIYYLIRYRRNIVHSNLKNSFPEKSAAEIEATAKKFYRNLCDLIVENIGMVSISAEETLKKFTLINFELIDRYHCEGKSVIVTIGHCGNWEFAGLATSLRVKHHVITFYRKLKNLHFDRFIRKQRSRFGMELLPHTAVRSMLQQEGKQTNMYIFITDQTPSNSLGSHWMQFLRQQTPVYRGTEKLARMTGHPVVYGDIQRVKRGHYSIEVKLLVENPMQTHEGEITELHTRALEEAIMRHPDNWLWTHRRWKKKKPAQI